MSYYIIGRDVLVRPSKKGHQGILNLEILYQLDSIDWFFKVISPGSFRLPLGHFKTTVVTLQKHARNGAYPRNKLIHYTLNCE